MNSGIKNLSWQHSAGKIFLPKAQQPQGINFLFVVSLLAVGSGLACFFPRAGVVPFAVPKINPSGQKADADDEKQQSDEKVQPVERHGAQGIVTMLGHIYKQGILHFQEPGHGRDSGYDQDDNCDESGNHQSHRCGRLPFGFFFIIHFSIDSVHFKANL